SKREVWSRGSTSHFARKPGTWRRCIRCEQVCPREPASASSPNRAFSPRRPSTCKSWTRTGLFSSAPPPWGTADCPSIRTCSAGLSLRPIGRLTQAARDIGLSGRLDKRLPPVNSRDEVARLVETFNHMMDRLESAFTAQRRFVADASHELRTPLTTIRGNIELLRRTRDLPTEEVDEALADIASEAQRMSRLVTELLRLARADAGQ